MSAVSHDVCETPDRWADLVLGDPALTRPLRVDHHLCTWARRDEDRVIRSLAKAITIADTPAKARPRTMRAPQRKSGISSSVVALEATHSASALVPSTTFHALRGSKGKQWEVPLILSAINFF